MKNLLLVLLFLPMIGFGQNVYIPDANFKAILISPFSGVNTNGDSCDWFKFKSINPAELLIYSMI